MPDLKFVNLVPEFEMDGHIEGEYIKTDAVHYSKHRHPLIKNKTFTFFISCYTENEQYRNIIYGCP